MFSKHWFLVGRRTPSWKYYWRVWHRNHGGKLLGDICNNTNVVEAHRASTYQLADVGLPPVFTIPEQQHVCTTNPSKNTSLNQVIKCRLNPSTVQGWSNYENRRPGSTWQTWNFRFRPSLRAPKLLPSFTTFCYGTGLIYQRGKLL